VLTGIIFDLDGVIADTHPIHRRGWKQLLTESGHHVSEEDLDYVLEGCRREEILHYFLGNLSAEELTRYGRRKDELFRQSAGQLRAIPGAMEFLHELERAKVPVALATSGGRNRTYQVLEQLGLADRFCGIVTGDDTVNGKKDPSIFCLAAHCLQLSPHQILVAEDSPAGVRAAKSAGMKCLGIASGALAVKLWREGADCVVPNFVGISLLKLQNIFMDPPPAIRSTKQVQDSSVGIL